MTAGRRGVEDVEAAESVVDEHTSPLDIDYEPPIEPSERRRKVLIIGFILVSVVLAASAQLTLKYGVDRVTLPDGSSGIDLSDPVGSAGRVASQPLVWLGLVLFAMSAVFWMIVLSRTSLSFAYPFLSFTYVLILVFDRVFLGEQIPLLRYVGVLFIMGGIVLVSRTRHHG